MKIGILYDGAERVVRPTSSSSARSDAVAAELASEGNEIVRHPGQPGREVDRQAPPGARGPRLQPLRVDRRRRRARAAGDLGARAAQHPVQRQLELDHGALPAQARRERACSSAPDFRCPSSPSSRRGGAIPSVGFPAICKPAAEDASIGVEQRSVVRTTRQLTERVSAMLERWDEVLIQRYIDGREVNVGILGDAVLPDRRDRLRPHAEGDVAHRHVQVQVGDRLRGGPRLGAALSGASAGRRRRAAAPRRASPRGGSSAAPATAASTCASTSAGARGSSR